MTLASAVVLLILVLDPFGNVPFFVAELGRVPAERRTRVVWRELLVAYAVMVAFLFAGRSVLAVLGISEPALTIAGGVLLFLIALRMVFPSPRTTTQRTCPASRSSCPSRSRTWPARRCSPRSCS